MDTLYDVKLAADLESTGALTVFGLNKFLI